MPLFEIAGLTRNDRKINPFVIPGLTRDLSKPVLSF